MDRRQITVEQRDAVFARRAEELAESARDERQDDETLEVLVFELGRELYALPANQVHEVRPLGSLTTLCVSLLVGSLGESALKEYAPGFVGNSVTAYVVSIAVSMLGVFVFLVSCYYVLTNDDLTVREVLPGAVLATVLLEATFQVLPFYQRYADVNPGLRAFGAPAILLVWLYVMANVIVFGAELNWWRSKRRDQQLVEELPGLA